MILLHQFEISPFCDKVRRILHLKGQPYQVRNLNMWQTLRGVPGRLHPAGKLPVLEHRGRRLADSTEIAYYLERLFPDPPLIPTDEGQRARVHFFEDWADESLYFYELHLRLAVAHNARRWVPQLTKNDPFWLRWSAPFLAPRRIAGITRTQGVGRKSPQQIQSDVQRHLQALETCLKAGDWLVGTYLSLADIAVFVQISCIAQTVEGEALLPDFPAVTAWMARVERDSAGGPAAP